MTTVQKDFHGNWRAEDRVDLAEDRVLTISTSKTHSGSLVTRATVSTQDGAFLSHVMYQDFSKTLASNSVRCTSKAVAAQHGDAMAKVDEVRKEVDSFYAA